MQGNRNRYGYALSFLLLALLLHALIVLPTLKVILAYMPNEESYSPFRVDLWNTKDSANLETDENKTPEEELEDYSPKEKIPKGQVVEAPPSKDRRKPKDAKYLSEHDSTVKRESKSDSQGGGSSGQLSSEKNQNGKDPKTEQGGSQERELHSVQLPENDLEETEKGEVSSLVKPNSSSPGLNLKPSMKALSSAIQGSGLDHLEEVFAGDATALNTVAWDHASFFNRVKRSVSRHWHPDIEYRKRDPYGNIYGIKDRTTVLLVVLNGNGSLNKLYVMNPSGVAFLDDEAFDAVNKAAPFPNVPDDLKSKTDGLVKFTFHFIVEVGSQPIVRMRRYD